MNEQKGVHFQDAFPDLYDTILVMTCTLCMSGEQWILGFIRPKKIMVTQYQPRAMTCPRLIQLDILDFTLSPTLFPLKSNLNTIESNELLIVYLVRAPDRASA